MHAEQKENLLREAVDRVHEVREATKTEIEMTSNQFERYRVLKDAVSQKLAQHFSERIDELHHLFPNPYFVRCDVSSESGDRKGLYFGKHQLIEQSIFSWTSPAARLRFSDIGSVEYPLTEGGIWKGDLERKDQFLISGGKIAFMTSEGVEYPRTLVYQEQLTRRKSGFILPEIVERMERAQDDVIRAHYRGSYLISGPAGSGKTTLAFHRIAYLLQSPDTADLFSQESVIAFVQDEQTKEYFSKLLPELGIHHVSVTTFAAWASEILGFGDRYEFVRRPNGVDAQIDGYEHRKLQAMRAMADAPVVKGRSSDPFALLRRVYFPYFNDEDRAIFGAQSESHTFDRFDLTLLLTFERRERGLVREEEYFEQKKNFEIRRRTKTVPISFALMFVDEVQNYLPEQIVLFRSCVSKDTEGLLYVGDLAQQVLVGTLRDWSEAGESLPSERRVVLDKVYRSTRQILSYIRNVGFEVVIPDEMRDGSQVEEYLCRNEAEAVALVSEKISEENEGAQVGVLGFDERALQVYRLQFADMGHIRVMTVHQSQGVEFDSVYLVGVTSDVFHTVGEGEGDLPLERRRIQRDLMYVALTRAMDKLTILGSASLKDLVRSMN